MYHSKSSRDHSLLNIAPLVVSALLADDRGKETIRAIIASHTDGASRISAIQAHSQKIFHPDTGSNQSQIRLFEELLEQTNWRDVDRELSEYYSGLRESIATSETPSGRRGWRESSREPAATTKSRPSSRVIILDK